MEGYTFQIKSIKSQKVYPHTGSGGYTYRTTYSFIVRQNKCIVKIVWVSAN